MTLPPDFDKTAWQLLEGNLSENEFEAFETLLSENEEARERYHEIVNLEVLLQQTLTQTSADTGVVPMEEVLRRQNHRHLRHSAFAAAALLCLLGITMGIIWSKPQQAPLSFRLSSDARYTVTHAEGASTTRESQTLEFGSRLQLEQGAIELTLQNGVEAMVRAPADLTLINEALLIQNQGIVRYVVPAPAVGFQVQTPQLLVTDFGTIFGVISDSEEQDQVHLFQGEIEVKCRLGLRKEQRLSGSNSVVAHKTGFLNPITSTPEFFLTSLEEKPPHLYFSFDDLHSKQFEVSGTSPERKKISAILTDPFNTEKEPQLVPRENGNALKLQGFGGSVQTNWPGIEGSSTRSVAAWLKLEPEYRKNRVQTIVSWGDSNVEGGKFEIITNPNKLRGKIGAIRLDCGGSYVVGESNLYDNQWHHVAVVMGGKMTDSSEMQVQIYVDGQKEATTSYWSDEPNTILGTNEDTWMNIGRYLDEQSFLKGSIDELYIFSGILTQSEVKQVMNGTW